MQHELIIKDTRGTIRIDARLQIDSTYYWKNNFRYDISTWHIPKGKRKEVLNNSIATDAEIYAAKMELWNKLKP